MPRSSVPLVACCCWPSSPWPSSSCSGRPLHAPPPLAARGALSSSQNTANRRNKAAHPLCARAMRGGARLTSTPCSPAAPLHALTASRVLHRSPPHNNNVLYRHHSLVSGRCSSMYTTRGLSVRFSLSSDDRHKSSSVCREILREFAPNRPVLQFESQVGVFRVVANACGCFQEH